MESVKEQLKEVLKHNTKWALMIESKKKINYPNMVSIDAKASSNDLGVKISDDGKFIYPNFLTYLLDNKDSKKISFLVIENLDKIETIEQEKFYEIIKYKSISGIKFPSNTSIIIQVEDNNKISKKIFDLSLLYKV